MKCVEIPNYILEYIKIDAGVAVKVHFHIFAHIYVFIDVHRFCKCVIHVLVYFYLKLAADKRGALPAPLNHYPIKIISNK